MSSNRNKNLVKIFGFTIFHLPTIIQKSFSCVKRRTQKIEIKEKEFPSDEEIVENLVSHCFLTHISPATYFIYARRWVRLNFLSRFSTLDNLIFLISQISEIVLGKFLICICEPFLKQSIMLITMIFFFF